MYNQMNVDYVALLWENFMYQAENKEISSARKEHMPYQFTKVTINHFISKDNTISMRNRINLHTIHDDTLLDTLKFVSKTKDYQKYGALISNVMINDDIKLYVAYKTYLDYATGKKGKQVKRPTKKATTALTIGVVIKDTLDKSVSKKKAPAKADSDSKDESDDVHDEDNNDEDDGNDDDSGNDAQDSKRADSDDDENPSFTLKDYKEEEQDEEYIHTPEKDKSDDEDKMYEEEDDDASGSSEGADFELKVLDEPKGKTKDTSDSKDESNDVHDEDNNNEDDGNDDDSGNDAQDSKRANSDDDENPSFTLKDYEEEEQDEEYIHTPEKDKSDDEDKMYEEEDDDEEDDGYVILSIVHDKTEGIVDNYLASKLKEEVNVAVRLQSNKLKEEFEAENQEFFNQVYSTMKAIIKEQVKAQVSKIIPQIELYVTESLGKSTQAEEPEFTDANTKMQQDQRNESDHIDDQPDNEAAPKHDPTIGIRASSGLDPNPMAPAQHSVGPELTALQSGRTRSALVNDPPTSSVPPTMQQFQELFQPMMVDEDKEFPPAAQIYPVYVNAAQAPENANGSPSTINISEGTPAVTPSSSASKSPSSDTDVLGSETPLDTFDNDFDDTYIAPETASAASSSSLVNINV
nr:hypothetical protein [Tanacetum cinerariifolium]